MDKKKIIIALIFTLVFVACNFGKMVDSQHQAAERWAEGSDNEEDKP